MTKRKIFIGTSGYNYPHWGDGVFYPQSFPSSQWLQYYSNCFDTVELNVTFYHLPEAKIFRQWHLKTPKDFSFAIKGNRFITHIKKLKDSKEPLQVFFNNASSLKEKLKVVLWQLPANFHLNLERLAEFTNTLKKNSIAKKFDHAFEFRHESWFCKDLHSLLEKNNFSLCIAHSDRWPTVEVTTANFIYLRFHGQRTLYGSNYSKKALKEWAVKAGVWLKEGKILFAYFNNDASGYAVKNARVFRTLLKA